MGSKIINATTPLIKQNCNVRLNPINLKNSGNNITGQSLEPMANPKAIAEKYLLFYKIIYGQNKKNTIIASKCMLPVSSRIINGFKV